MEKNNNNNNNSPFAIEYFLLLEFKPIFVDAKCVCVCFVSLLCNVVVSFFISHVPNNNILIKKESIHVIIDSDSVPNGLLHRKCVFEKPHQKQFNLPMGISRRKKKKAYT